MKSRNDLIEVLKPCPFCGSDAEILLIGNAYTKKRAAEIKCKGFGCKVTIRVGVIRQSLDWAREKAIEKWNTRALESNNLLLDRMREAVEKMRNAGAGRATFKADVLVLIDELQK